jgi:hypothetical protein
VPEDEVLFAVLDPLDLLKPVSISCDFFVLNSEPMQFDDSVDELFPLDPQLSVGVAWKLSDWCEVQSIVSLC